MTGVSVGAVGTIDGVAVGAVDTIDGVTVGVVAIVGAGVGVESRQGDISGGQYPQMIGKYQTSTRTGSAAGVIPAGRTSCPRAPP